MTDRILVFKEWFAVAPSTARVVDALYGANGDVVAQDALTAAGQQTRNGLMLTIKRLRHVMDPGSIENSFGVGYRLTPAGLTDCDRALADAVRRAAEERAA